MKMSREDYSLLERHIAAVLSKNPTAVEMYQEGRFQRADKVKCLQRRFCWDLYWASGVKLAGDYDNSHIETALRRVCPAVVRGY